MDKNIPVIILCGGQGTRIRDGGENTPKPMLQIGGYPILWHIMRIYATNGYFNFILALGYKGWVIKEYFLNYQVMSSDFSLRLGKESGITFLESHEPLEWNIKFVDTGEITQTGKRIYMCGKYIENEEFMVTYGDGVANIDIAELHEFHRRHGKIATVTGVTPPSRFGALSAVGNTVVEFNEKKDAGGGLINGGFFVFRKDFLDILASAGDTMLETTPMAKLTARNELKMFHHTGFWEPMDTMREYLLLNKLWEGGRAPWKIWE